MTSPPYFRLNGRIASVRPILVTGNERDLVNLEACFEQAASSFMTKVVKMQVCDFEAFAGPRERRAG